jgi:hypothetical protein
VLLQVLVAARRGHFGHFEHFEPPSMLSKRIECNIDVYVGCCLFTQGHAATQIVAVCRNVWLDL